MPQASNSNVSNSINPCFTNFNSHAVNARICYIKYSRFDPLHFTTADLFITLIHGMVLNTNINENVQPPVYLEIVTKYNAIHFVN